MISQPKVTVLIPCHSLRYLNRSISSINSQTLALDLFEVLLVTDRIDVLEAKSVLDELFAKFRIIKSDIPGIVPALNLGLQHVNSKYVARMDEDDIMMPNRLEKQLKFLEEKKEVLAVGGQLLLIDQSDTTIGKAIYRQKIRLLEKDLLAKSPLPHPATMFRLDSVRSVGGYRDFLPEDWDLWIRLREIGPIENLSDTVLKYRIHPGQLSKEKMYSQSIGKSFVAASYFARKSNVRDCPETTESPEEWLQYTQVILRQKSKKYVKFETFDKKLEKVNLIFESCGKIQKVYKTLSVGFQNPLVLIYYVYTRFSAKVKRHYS